VKAITLWQPWASLWAAGIKRNETRSWTTSHRGPLLIHAAKLTHMQLADKIGATAYFKLSDICVDTLGILISDLARGCIVGRVDVVGCFKVVECTFSDGSVGPSWQITGIDEMNWPGMLEASLGDYSPGRYAWIGAHHRVCEPIPCRGGQRLWNVPPGVLGFDWTCPGCGTQNPSSNTHCPCELQYDRGMVDP